MADAARDSNYITTLLGVSNADGTTPVTLYADPTTHRLLVSATSGSLDDLSDVVITSGAQGDILYNNGTNWVNLGAGTSGHFLKTQGAGANPVWAEASAAAGATTALDNLASVAINTTLVSDTDNTDALGTSAKAWSDIFLGSGAVITFNSAPSTPDVTITHSADTLTFAGGTVALGTATATGGLTGNVTGNVTGSAATVTGAAQTAITSVGTLTALDVDNININGNTISSTAGTDLLITPLAGQQIVLDGTIIIDAGVVTGATSITSTTFVGALTGTASGNLVDVVDDTTPTLGGALDAGGFDINNGGVIFLTEQAAAEADVAGKGQIWVLTATPNVLKFTDDAGTDFTIATNATTTLGSLGTVSTSLTGVLRADSGVLSADTDVTDLVDNLAVSQLADGTDGQLITWDAAGAPATVATGSSGQVLTSNGAGAAPTFQAAASGGISWTEVTGTSQSAAVNNGYITNNAGLVTVTLPDTAAVGSIVRIAGSGAGGWKLAQNASEIVHFAGLSTTTGTGGSLASTVRYDAVEVVCIVANTEWVVISSLGNITIV